MFIHSEFSMVHPLGRLTRCRGISLVAETIARSLKFGSQLTCEKTPGSHIYPLDVSNHIFFSVLEKHQSNKCNDGTQCMFFRA